MSRLVFASNRVATDPARPAPGGLVVALRGALRDSGGLWFGWSGRVARRASPVPRIAQAGAMQAATLDLGQGEHAGFYRGYCNAVLWPLCHGLDAGAVPGPRVVAAWYRSYRRTNRRYAAALAPLLRNGDRLWVHDFHLIPLGAMLRQAGVTQPLGFFLHVPFPAPGRLAALSQAASLVRALLRYDVVGFQTDRDLDAFRAALRQLPGVSGARRTRGARLLPELLAIPVGIDVDAVRREARAPGAVAAAAAILAAHPRLQRTPGSPLMLGVDRLDPAKGLGERLRAYDRLLALPGARRLDPALLQVVSPPRGIAADAAVERRSVAQLARRLNLRHGAPGTPPLHLLEAALPHATVMALLARARVGVVSPLRDGMNLVAKEFVAAQDPADPGMLVLSVHAGAARELAAALQADPRDAGALAAALHRALRMPLEERRGRHAAMLEVLRRHDLRAWSTGFLERLPVSELTGNSAATAGCAAAAPLSAG